MGLFTEKAKDYASEKARSAAHKARKAGSIQVNGAEEAKTRALVKHNKALPRLNRELRNAKKSKNEEQIKRAEAALDQHKKDAERIEGRKTGGFF